MYVPPTRKNRALLLLAIGEGVEAVDDTVEVGFEVDEGFLAFIAGVGAFLGDEVADVVSEQPHVVAPGFVEQGFNLAR